MCYLGAVFSVKNQNVWLLASRRLELVKLWNARFRFASIFYGLEFGLDPCVLRRTKQECIEPQTVVGEDIHTRALRITVLILSRRVPSLLRSYRIQSYEP